PLDVEIEAPSVRSFASTTVPIVVENGGAKPPPGAQPIPSADPVEFAGCPASGTGAPPVGGSDPPPPPEPVPPPTSIAEFVAKKRGRPAPRRSYDPSGSATRERSTAAPPAGGSDDATTEHRQDQPSPQVSSAVKATSPSKASRYPGTFVAGSAARVERST